MSTTKEKIEVMQAFNDGKEIQVSHGNDSWYSSLAPIWDWCNNTYRVKPKSELEIVIENEKKALATMERDGMNTQADLDYKEGEIVGLERALYLSTKA